MKRKKIIKLLKEKEKVCRVESEKMISDVHCYYWRGRAESFYWLIERLKADSKSKLKSNR